MTPRVTSIAVPISDYAIALEDELVSILKPPAAGYYTRTSKAPLMTPNKRYHQIVKGVTSYITQPSDIVSNVYDDEGECVYKIPPNGKVELFEKPMVPTVGISIVHEFVDQIFCTYCKWVRNNPCLSDRLQPHLNLQEQPAVVRVNGELASPQDARYAAAVAHHATTPSSTAPEVTVDYLPSLPSFYEKRINAVLANLKEDLVRFIGEDDWHRYGLAIRGRTLYVDKGEDYRIEEWMRMKEAGLIP